jgi:2-C-methyl-D-erythritol 4-phosphate cytidylyltransferase
MYQNKRIGAVLLMGGMGARFQSTIPKQFHPLCGKKVYEHALDTMRASKFFDEIVLVCHPDWLDLPFDRVVVGGKTRQESSFLGLRAFEMRPEIVLIHDAVRPFITEKILKSNLDAAILYGAVDTCIPTADTLVYAPHQDIAAIPNRTHYLRGQTPQTFKMDWILEAHEKASMDGVLNASDDCQLILRMGKKIAIVEGSERNIKITSELDLLVAKHLVDLYPNFCYPVHRNQGV